MPKYSPEMRDRARRLRDTLLAQVEDKNDPRYLALVSQIAQDEAKSRVETVRVAARPEHLAGR